MIQKDFILRQIQQLVQVLAHVLNLKREGLFEEARVEINEALNEVFGTGMRDLLSLDDSKLISLCEEGGKLNADKAFVLAELIEEEGNIQAMQGNGDDAIKAFMSALTLFETLIASGEAIPLDIYDRIEHLKSQLSEID